MPTYPTKPVEVFYSYAHEDDALRKKLDTHLSGLKLRGVISKWHDRDISPGNEWNKEISEHLESASLILLLVSPDFLSSEYCNDVEVKRAMQRHEEGTAKVIPIILRATKWDGLPFSKLKALPSDGRPVTSWSNEDEAFLNVANHIEEAINKLKESPSFAPGQPGTAQLSPLSRIEHESSVGFVDRKDRDGADFIKRLRIELAPGTGRVVALWGAGGVGKTALAAEAARSLVEDYKQRVAWVTADGRDEFNLANLLDEIAGQLSNSVLRTLSLEAKKDAVRQLVVEAPSLIVLDNFETVKKQQQSHCLDWLSRISPSSALITTRAKIETPAVRNLPIESLSGSEANEFLDRLIQQAQDRRTFDGVDKNLVIKTAEANPLILQWVFAQIDLAQDWREVLDELAQGEGEAAHRVFDRSFKLPLLHNGGRAALLALSLFVPSASRPALAEVAALSGERNKKKFREAIKHLAALWLLRSTEAGARVTVEGLTRDLTTARLGSDARGDAIRHRFVERFARFARNNNRGTASDLNALESERENLLNAIDVAVATKNWASATSIYLDITNFLDIRGYWDEAMGRGEKLRALALEIKDKRRLSSIAQVVANVRSVRGEYDEAEQIYNETLAVFRDLKSESNIGITLHNLGILADRRGKVDEARRLYEEALEIDERMGDETGIAATLNALGTLSHDEGEIGEARRLYSESLKLHKKLGNQVEAARLLFNLGRLYEDEGEFDKARQLYNEVLEINKKLRTPIGIAAALDALGILSRRQGQIAEALKLHNESLEINKRLGTPTGIAHSLFNLGILAHEDGKQAEARQLYNESLEISKSLGSEIGLAATLHQLGRLDLDEGRIESAERLLNQALSILRDSKAKKNVSECLETWGMLKASQGLLDDARVFYRESLELAQALGDKWRIASVKRSSALLAEKKKDHVEAAKLLHESLEIFDGLSSSMTEEVKADLRRIQASEESVQ